tara:strand:+ start:1959 stop:2252 length:294 start_codon:yes stop_codon:yes gene_type:complete
MARTTKAVLVTAETKQPKEKKITLTREQFDALSKASQQITEARRALNDVGEAETLAHIGFIAGQAFFAVNQVEDVLDEIINDIDPDDDDNSWGDLDI